MDLIWTIIINLSGIAAIGIALIKYFSKLVEQKLILNWQQKNNEDTEYLKAQINSNQSLVNSSLTTFLSGHSFAQEKRLESIENMWKKVLSIRSFASPITTFYTVLLPSEYNQQLGKKDSVFHITVTRESFHEFIVSEDIEVYRPYLGETLWSLFFAYRAFMFRLVHLFIEARDKGIPLPPWYDDKHLIAILKSAVLKEDLNNLKLDELSSLSYVLVSLEQRILMETNKIITGEFASDSSFKEAKRLIEIINKNGM